MNAFDAILLGGGSGSRFSASGGPPAGLPKQFQKLGHSPVFVHALRAFFEMGCFRRFLLVVPREHLPSAQRLMDEFLEDAERERVSLVPGGSERKDSSRLALEALEQSAHPPTRVAIHDACRPYLSHEFRRRIVQVLQDRSYAAWIPVIPVTETLKRVDQGRVVATVDRNQIHRVQTPQIFEYTLIRSLALRAADVPLPFTDDASLCEHFGVPVGVFPGDVRNLKLTFEHEMDTLRNYLSAPLSLENSCASESDTTFTA